MALATWQCVADIARGDVAGVRAGTESFPRGSLAVGWLVLMWQCDADDSC